MQVIISTRGMTISGTYKDALTRKLARLEPMLPKIIETKAVLSKEKHRRTAALTVVAKDHAFRSEETADDLAAAVDRAVDALRRQVREMKARVKNRKGRGSPRHVTPVMPAPEPAPALPSIAVSRVALETMSLTEAVEQLRAAREECLVFSNIRTDAVNVLYLKRDGSLGLLEPLA